jgi:hypothetical protein
MGDRIGGPGAPGPHTKPDACPSCGAPGGKPPAGPCADPYHGEGRREPMLPPGSYLFGVEQLEETLLQVAGAASAVFMSEDPQKVMPSAELIEAVAEWARASTEILGPASQRALELERGDLRGRAVEKIRDYRSRAEAAKKAHNEEERVRLERCANVLNNLLWEEDDAASRADVADVAADAEDPLFRRAAEQDAVRRREVGISAEGVDLTRSIVCKAGEHARCKMPVCRCSCHGAKQ